MVILGYRAGALLKKTWKETLEDNVLSIASQVAYNFFFSLFPLLLFLAPMLSLLGDKRTIVSDLLSRFSEFMPAEAFALFSKVVTDIVFAQNAPGLISLGFVLAIWSGSRSEEHTSELQSQFHLVCRLLLEKKKRCRVPGCRRAPSA